MLTLTQMKKVISNPITKLQNIQNYNRNVLDYTSGVAQIPQNTFSKSINGIKNTFSDLQQQQQTKTLQSLNFKRIQNFSSSDNNNGQNNNKSNQNDSENNKKQVLETISLRKSWKSANVPENANTHILFSSHQALLPYTKLNCQIKLGNLSNIDKPLAFFLLNEYGESYTIGIQLQKNLETQLKSHVSKIQDKRVRKSPLQTDQNPSTTPSDNTAANETASTTNIIDQEQTIAPPAAAEENISNQFLNDTQSEFSINPQNSMPNNLNSVTTFNSKEVKVELSTKKMANRVKIVELIVADDGIFAQTVPFKDREPNKEDFNYNIQNDWSEIKQLVQSINKSLSYEHIVGFNEIELERLNFREFDSDQIDRVIFQLINNMHNLYNKFMSVNINSLIQSIFESNSPIDRLILTRFHLQSLEGVLKIVDHSIRKADEHLIRMQNQYRATLSIEYIKANYYRQNSQSGNNNSQSEGGSGGSSKGASSSNNKSENQQSSSSNEEAGSFDTMAQQTPATLAKQYMDKLHLIEEKACRDQIKGEIERFSMLDQNASQFHQVVTYLEQVFNLPWQTFSPAFWDIQYANKVLDEEMFGLEQVQQRIIQMIAVNQIQNSQSNSKGFVVLLYGPPGTGQSSIAKAVAQSLKKESRFISFAGVTDPHFIKGHRRTYVDAQPGIFVKQLSKAQTQNPVFIVDEIDKISRSSHGADPYYALMEILNPEESQNFTDHYLDIKFDFSNVVFILTANEVLNMLAPLRDRLEIIEIPAYVQEEKLKIAKQYIIPKALESNGLPLELIKFNDEAIAFIIRNWCFYQSGVRELQRCFETISRKYAVDIITKFPELNQYINKINSDAIENEESSQSIDNNKQVTQNIKESEKISQQLIVSENESSNQKETIQQIYGNSVQGNNKKDEQTNKSLKTVSKQQEVQKLFLTPEIINQYKIEPLDLTATNSFEIIKKYLGVPQYDSQYQERKNRIFPPGTINILTVGGFSGSVLTLECAFDYSHPDKQGHFTSSGNLKEVLKESLTIAKINAFRYLTQEQIQNVCEKNVHLHFMQGGTPKDGPSAGTAICTAFLSLVLDKPVPSNFSMTGELSLQGEVCKIGGIQAKLIASQAVGATNVIVPYTNMADVMELPQMLLNGMKIYFVREYQQIYGLIFEEKRTQEIPQGVDILDNGVFIKSIDLQIGNIQNISSSISSTII